MKSNERRAGQGQPGLLHTVACKACGAEWKIDPAIRVVCFECEAQPGEPCRWDRPHCHAFHLRRDQLAMREGHLSVCEALTWDGRHSRHAIRVCEPTQPALL